METIIRGHLLVVDDNEMNRDVLVRRLERQGHTVEIARDGEEALDMMRAQPFDLVLLDIMMPKVNGFQVLEQMQTDLRLRDVSVIVISALDELESVVKCIELGAEDYLFKPFNPVLLRARVNASLQKLQLRRQADALPLEINAYVQTIVHSAAMLADGDNLTDTQRQLLAVIQTHGEAVAQLILSSAER